jgi:elongation factor P--(R)-beta-lysine ligase
LSVTWQPTATLQSLKERAYLYRQIREFFAQRDVLEVDTPLLCQYGVTSPHVENVEVHTEQGFLQTSPEYAMKRLLAYGSECIYQICKAFRASETGRYHNTEFSILEWYRLNTDYQHLMKETIELITNYIGSSQVEYVLYRDIFIKHLNIDPFNSTLYELQQACLSLTTCQTTLSDETQCLDLLFSLKIEPLLTHSESEYSIVCVMDYPSNQTSLAETYHASYGHVARRFEIYVNGIELANGYQELSNANTVYKNLEQEQAHRKELGLCCVEIDHHLIDALEHGLPRCSGVALGLDRLLMIKLGEDNINKVIAFTRGNA